MTHLSPIDDWRELTPVRSDDRGSANPRRRLRLLLAVYGAALLVVLGRALQLELQGGAEFRRIANAPIEKPVILEAERGRILARDGTVLAADHQARALAVHYRYLQAEPDERWLRRQVRSRLTRAERRDAARVDQMQRTVRGEIEALHQRLAAMCRLSDEQWRRRLSRIEQRVEQMAESVNRARERNFVEQTATVPATSDGGAWSVLTGLFAPPEKLPPAEITVAEQAAFHRIVTNVPAEVARAIESDPAAFPGVQIVTYIRRDYPQAMLAANLLGHVGLGSSAQATLVAVEPTTASPQVAGLAGIEGAYDQHLTGTTGLARRFVDRRGELVDTRIERRAVAGRDLVLSLDPALQQFAEQLLDRWAERRQTADHPSPESGGAAVVMNVHTGDVLAAAAYPRFDPNWFATGDPRVEAVLTDRSKPLFDRATRMAIPPGSVFKPLTALALLEHGVVRPAETFACQGYLESPDRMRCQLFRQHGIGHGDVDLAGALAQSCNVYFFHHVTGLGPERLVGWAERLGFGGKAGRLPRADEVNSQDELQSLSIGQGTLTATPLQVIGLYAAIANGGYRVTPRLVLDAVDRQSPGSTGRPAISEARRIAGLDERTIAAVHEGLCRVVEDPSGTAFATVRIADFPIAGKTGTAENGGGLPDHAWFAGYAPAGAPQLVVVVALEHGGSGSTAAGSLARHLFERLRQLGYFGRPRMAAETSFPPGKG